ncbi:MAG TPA: PA2778 family cysteine peptidase [Steroidobacteraceae bacterium]|nr:PA2778 family cysteine peptidase [Steroidobacteraceae bacterium]
MRFAALPAAALAALLAGCASSPRLAEGLPPAAPRSIELASVPFHPQEDFQCGPAALATVLGASGIDVAPATLAPQTFIPKRKGSLQAELIGAARRHGRVAYLLPGHGDALVAELSEGRPVLLLQNLGTDLLPRWHYAVLVGYDADRNVATLRSGTRQRLEMRWQRFAASWHRAGRWAIAVLPPEAIPAHATPDRYLEAVAGLEAAGERRAAAAAYDTAIARWPEEPLFWLGRGNVAFADGELEAAADKYLRAILLAPQDAAARNNLALTLAGAGCFDEARRQLERAAAFAAGTPLMKSVEDSRDRIQQLMPAGGSCRLADRAWPD